MLNMELTYALVHTDSSRQLSRLTGRCISSITCILITSVNNLADDQFSQQIGVYLFTDSNVR